jgi:hypothetical protein
MTDYRRNFIAGGSLFFTVDLAERRLRLLAQHIDEQRTGSERHADIIRSRSRRWSCCPIIFTRFGRGQQTP